MPTSEDFQIRLWADRYRGAETLFQPSIVGLECEGISEIFENMLSRFGRPPREPVIDASASFKQLQSSSDMRARLMSYVLLTGGNTLVKGFDQRIEQELRMLNQVGTKINVVKAYDARLDSWRGGALFAQ